RNAVHTLLKNGESVSFPNIGIPSLVYSDIEVEFTTKENLMSSTGKVGAIVLDTKLNDYLLSLGFMLDFRSCIQNLRKDTELNLTDKIYLEVFCEQERANSLQGFLLRLKNDLLATDIKFFSSYEIDHLMHKFLFHRGVLKTESQIESDAEIDK